MLSMDAAQTLKLQRNANQVFFAFAAQDKKKIYIYIISLSESASLLNLTFIYVCMVNIINWIAGSPETPKTGTL